MKMFLSQVEILLKILVKQYQKLACNCCKSIQFSTITEGRSRQYVRQRRQLNRTQKIVTLTPFLRGRRLLCKIIGYI